MASRQEVPRRRPVPRLCLVTQPVDDASAFLRAIEPALAVADIAAVIMRLGRHDEQRLTELVKAIAPAVQGRGVALLVDAHVEVAIRAGADGAHITGAALSAQAVRKLKPALIAGAGGLATRDDAMRAGEMGVDYVLFGEPDGDGRWPPFLSVQERVAWWSDIVEVPCMGFAGSLDEASALADAGADFVALGDVVWKDARGSAAAVASAAERLRSVELV